MSGPFPRDLQARVIDTHTVNDSRQYGQSAFGHFSDTERGHRQGMSTDEAQVARRGPFELAETSPLAELRQEIATQVYGEQPPPVVPLESGDFTGYEAGPEDTSYGNSTDGDAGGYVGS